MIKLRDWVIDDTVSYFYFSYFVAFILVSVCIAILALFYIFKELKESFIDILRMIQCIYIFTWQCYVIYLISSNLWKEKIDPIFFKLSICILYVLMHIYYWLNLISWSLLINHIQILNQLRNGIEYQKCKKQIKNTEIKIIIMVWFACFYPILNVSILLFSNYVLQKSVNMDFIYNVEFFITYPWLLTLNVILFKRFLTLKFN